MRSRIDSESILRACTMLAGRRPGPTRELRWPAEFDEHLERLGFDRGDHHALRSIIRDAALALATEWECSDLAKGLRYQMGRPLPTGGFLERIKDFEKNKPVRGLLYGYAVCLEGCPKHGTAKLLGATRATLERWWHQVLPDLSLAVSRLLNERLADRTDSQLESDVKADRSASFSSASTAFKQISHRKVIELWSNGGHIEINDLLIRARDAKRLLSEGLFHEMSAFRSGEDWDVIPDVPQPTALASMRSTVGAKLLHIDQRDRGSTLHCEAETGGGRPRSRVKIRLPLNLQDGCEIGYRYWLATQHDLSNGGEFETYLSPVQGNIEGAVDLVVRMYDDYPLLSGPEFDWALVYSPDLFPSEGTLVTPRKSVLGRRAEYVVALPELAGSIRVRWTVSPTARGTSAGEASDDLQLMQGIVDDINPLTTRERQVLGLVAEGETNKEIAARLSLSEHTVRAHLRLIMKKLGVNNRVQVAASALQLSAR